MTRWKLEDAEKRFSEVARNALVGEPQLVLCGERDAVVVLSVAEYDRLRRPARSLVEFLTDSPLAAGELNLQRSHDPGRAVEV